MDRVIRAASLLRSKGVVARLKEAEEDINKYLKPCIENMLLDDFLMVLRRWNSYTPALRTTDENSLGGGYFISWHGKGIIIDPGFDFIRNFHNEGLSIGCIHAIIMTHSHLDHISDFEPLLTLLYEYNEQRRKDIEAGKLSSKPKYIHIYASPGTLRKCSGWLDYSHTARKGETMISRIYAMDPFSVQMPINIPQTDIFIKPTYAEHNELIASGYSTGVLVDLYDGDKREVSIGFTGDSAWTEEVSVQYDDSDILVMHIGTVTQRELITLEPYKKHLGAIGCLNFLKNESDKRKMNIFSEFGEEFRETRREIMATIKSVSKRPQACIVADVGTKISLPDVKLRCEFTNCKAEAMPDDYYEYYGIVKHYCSAHVQYKTKWAFFDDI
ncbi:MAG: MBL fold metallo-hydrolase [Candidatus Magnetoovum sp. WYHC-5]|nr:MBL fold metallo-hydrolase [Candidatus Magnetoovum sp. WYHC-5]